MCEHQDSEARVFSAGENYRNASPGLGLVSSLSFYAFLSRTSNPRILCCVYRPPRFIQVKPWK